MKNLKAYSLMPLMLLGACSLAPDFEMPSLNLPASFKNEQAEVEDAKQFKNWWEVFDNKQLSEFIEKANSNNLDIQIAQERVKQARATAGINYGDLLPTVDGVVGASRTKYSSNGGGAFNGVILNNYRINAIASYEPDILGRNYSSYLSALYTSEEEEANFEAIKLAMQAEVAIYYHTIANLDKELELLDKALKLSRENADIATKRQEIGDIDKVQFAAIKLQTNNVEIEYIEAKDLRKNLENAFAILIGENPSSFKMPALEYAGDVPAIPAGLPSEMLKRRPDVKAAIKNMESFNESVGVARTAFYPNISISASGGMESSELSDLLKPNSRTWSLGFLNVDIPIFSGGKAENNLDRTKSQLTQAQAEYKLAVNRAFEDVENALSSVSSSAEAVKLASESATLSKDAYGAGRMRYDEGYSSYLEMLLAESNYINAQRAELNQQTKQITATINLIKALGGGWN